LLLPRSADLQCLSLFALAVASVRILLLGACDISGVHSTLGREIILVRLIGGFSLRVFFSVWGRYLPRVGKPSGSAVIHLRGERSFSVGCAILSSGCDLWDTFPARGHPFPVRGAHLARISRGLFSVCRLCPLSLRSRGAPFSRAILGGTPGYPVVIPRLCAFSVDAVPGALRVSGFRITRHFVSRCLGPGWFAQCVMASSL